MRRRSMRCFTRCSIRPRSARSSHAVKAAADGRDVILVRPVTEADDVTGFHAAKGIVTSEGGKASHAALVARGMGVPAVTGASALEIDVSAGAVPTPDRKRGVA